MQKDKFYQHRYQLARDFTASSSRYDRLRELILGLQPKKFLDIGCGDGSFLYSIARSGSKIVCFGLEIKATGKDPMIFKCDIDREPIPIRAGTNFDLVFAGEIIEHLFDPEHMLDEIKRVLAPDGYLVLTTPNLAAWYNRLSLLLGRQPVFAGVGLRGTYGTLWSIHAESHLRLYTLPALRGLLESCGFNILKTFGFGINNQVGWGKRHPILTRIANRLFSSPGLSSLLVIVAQKKKTQANNVL